MRIAEATIIGIGAVWIIIFIVLWYIQRLELRSYNREIKHFIKILQQDTIINRNVITIEQKKMMEDIVKTLIEKFPESKELPKLLNSLYKL